MKNKDKKYGEITIKMRLSGTLNEFIDFVSKQLRSFLNDPGIRTHPFDREGTALSDLTLVRAGVVENLSYDRFWAYVVEDDMWRALQLGPEGLQASVPRKVAGR